MSGAIFISYRRDDSEGEAGRLYDDLVRTFRAPGAVFMDVSDIHPGKDFRKAIDDNVAQCSVLLAMIGPGWTTIKDASGVRRLDQPNDFVRLEIASALARGVDVVPVLVHGARMPAPADLPENLQDLAYRNGVELTHARWNSDVEVLVRALRSYVSTGADLPTRAIRRAIEGDSAPPDPVPAAAPSAVGAVANFTEETAKPITDADKKNSKPWIKNLAWGIAILVIAGVVLYQHRTETPAVATNGSQSADTPSSSPAGTGGSATTREYISRLSGTWTNAQAQNGKPMRVQIGPRGDLASIHIWNRCGAATCDMGEKSTGLHGDGITIDWTGQFSNAGNEQIVAQTVEMRIYRIGPALHMIYSNTQNGSTGFDFVLSQ